MQQWIYKLFKLFTFFWGQNFFFFRVKKNFFWGHGSLKVWWNAHKNLGGIMPRFGTWAIILEIMVIDHNFVFIIIFLIFKKWCCTFPISSPQSHIAQSHISTNKQTLPPTQLEPPPSGLPALLAPTEPLHCLLRKH
jgi:hypothetical protein